MNRYEVTYGGVSKIVSADNPREALNKTQGYRRCEEPLQIMEGLWTGKIKKLPIHVRVQLIAEAN